MLSAAIIIAVAFAAQAVDLTNHHTTSLHSGNWGYLKLMNNRNKCYGVNMGQDNRFYSRNCNTYDDTQLWRYDSKWATFKSKF